MFFRYLRTENRVPFGVVAVREDGQFGVSLCSPKDVFLKVRGRDIASARADLNEHPTEMDGQLYVTRRSAIQRNGHGAIPARRADLVRRQIEWSIVQAKKYYQPKEAA
jgi:hypothetical protein